MIVSLRPGPGPGCVIADFPKASLGVRETVVRPGGRKRPLAGPFRTVVAGSGGSLGCRDPGPLLLRCSWPALTVGLKVRWPVGAVLLV